MITLAHFFFLIRTDIAQLLIYILHLRHEQKISGFLNTSQKHQKIKNIAQNMR